jgi:hypothetical protein
MTPDLPGWSTFLLAAAGVIGAVSAVFLNRRGQAQQAIQQEAANDLATRAQGFDEMQVIVKELRLEIKRLSESKDQELAAQARRCHSALDHFVIAFTTLQGQVFGESAKRAGDAALAEVEQHNALDHPPEENP